MLEIEQLNRKKHSKSKADVLSIKDLSATVMYNV